MKIKIVQSVSPNHPAWIDRCMTSVRDWALSKGYDYQVIGDELFEYFPPDLPDGGYKLVKTDYARVAYLRRSMQLGECDVSFWFDSDVVLWAPERFELAVPPDQGMTVTQEEWFSSFIRTPIYYAESKINNCIIGFRGTGSADFLLHLYEHSLKYKKIDNWCLGPGLLTPLVFSGLYKPTIQGGIGCFGGKAFTEIRSNGSKFVKFMRRCHGGAIHGANLVSSLNIDSSTMNSVIDSLSNELKSAFSSGNIGRKRIGEKTPIQFFVGACRMFYRKFKSLGIL